MGEYKTYDSLSQQQALKLTWMFMTDAFGQQALWIFIMAFNIIII